MASDPHLDAGGIVQRQFTTARRGYDADEVRAYLHELSKLVGNLQRGENELRERAEKAESRAQKAEQLDEHRLVEILGEETARVLDAARAASTDIRGKAEESASRLISEANREAHRVRAEAEATQTAQRAELLAEVERLRADAAGELERRRAEGHEIVAQMRREAQAECDTLRQQGEQKRLEAEMQAETIRAKAREEGRALISEAQVVRERVLGDLARRRRSAREQLERLNAARERLLAAYEVVRRTVDEATSELTVVLPEAKVAGDSAVRRVQGEPEPSVEQLEDMVAMARITGLLEDAASQGFDEEDYLADDVPAPPVGAGADEATAAAVAAVASVADDPVELYDVESEDDLFADDVDVDAGVDADAGVGAGAGHGRGDGESEDGDAGDVGGVAAVVELVPEADLVELHEGDPGAEDADVHGGGGQQPGDAAAVGPEPAAGDPSSVAQAGRGGPMTVNGQARPVASGVPAVAPPVGPGPAPEPAVPAAAVALASEPAVDVEGVAEPALAVSVAEIVDDRRVNGHPHPSVEVDDDEDDPEGGDDDADHAADDDDLDDDLDLDLDEDEWFDEDDEDGAGEGATSSVDELFARLRAGRDQPAPASDLSVAGEGDHAVDVAATGLAEQDIEDDLGPGATPAGWRPASSLAAMSDADILASAGYGDAGEDGYGGYHPDDGDHDDDDLTGGDDDDIYGLPATRPGDQAVVEDLEDLEDLDEGDDGGDADFADMHPDEAMLRLRDDSLETVEHDLARRLKRVLADEQNEILDTLRRHKPSTLDELLPGGREAHVASYAEAAAEALSTAAAWGAASVEGEPGGSYEALAGELGVTVVDPLRERIARSFAEGAGDVDDVTGRLRALYREWKGHHLGAAAQHYAVAAYARGAYEAVPDGTPVRWLVDRRTDSCPDADDNSLAESVCKGEAFPTGDRCAPAHPGCRCMVVPLDWPQLG
jgi:DivIVA domain-containing protein